MKNFNQIEIKLIKLPSQDLATQCQWHDAWNGKELTFFNASLFRHSESHTNKTVVEIYVVFSRYVRVTFQTDGFRYLENYYEFGKEATLIFRSTDKVAVSDVLLFCSLNFLVIEDGSDAKLLHRHGYYSSDQLGSFYLKDSSTAVDPIKITFEFSTSDLWSLLHLHYTV